jgi:hypothetical protein
MLNWNNGNADDNSLKYLVASSVMSGVPPSHSGSGPLIATLVNDTIALSTITLVID